MRRSSSIVPFERALREDIFAPKFRLGGFVADEAYIGPTLRIEGEIVADENLRIDGSVKGSLSAGGNRITLGEMAFLRADIVAREVVVHGASQGNLRACDRIEIKKHSCVEGDVTAAQVIVEEGAHFKGRVDTDGGAPVGADLQTLLGLAEARALQHSAARSESNAPLPCQPTRIPPK